LSNIAENSPKTLIPGWFNLRATARFCFQTKGDKFALPFSSDCNKKNSPLARSIPTQKSHLASLHHNLESAASRNRYFC
jgi:hypothetical protein